MGYPHGMFGWADLAVPDTEAATRFYGEVFGWEASGAEMGYTFFQIGGRNVVGMGKLSAEQQEAGFPPMWSSYVIVDDVDPIAARAAELGANVLMPPMDITTVGRMTYIQDPTGAHLGFWQAGDHRGADLFNEPGAMTWNELATRNADAAIGFYTELLPWKPDTQDMGGFVYTTLMLGDGPNGGVYEMDSTIPAEVPAHWAVYFASDDTDAAVARATDLGARVLMPTMDTPFGRVAGLSDPQGAAFRVITLASQD